MPTRHTKIIPGFDDILNGCAHTPRGEHGRNGEEWLYIVRSDDGNAALYLEVHTSLYPSTTEHRELPPAGVRGLRLELHLAVPYVDYDGEICHPRPQRGQCAILDRPLCTCPEYSSLYSMKFFDDHYVKGATPEQPESFWLALEAELAEQLLKINFFNEDEDEERMLGWLRDPRTTPASHRDVVRWIGQNAFKAAQLTKQAEIDREATAKMNQEIAEETAKLSELTKQVELAQAMIEGLAKPDPAPPPVAAPARPLARQQRAKHDEERRQKTVDVEKEKRRKQFEELSREFAPASAPSEPTPRYEDTHCLGSCSRGGDGPACDKIGCQG